MTEVAHVSKDHGNSMLISGSDNFIITNRTAWLNYAVMPTAAAASIPSRNGKKASEAITAPAT
ncbi:Uncharacterised protein [Budvicia aquatica]|uniref:Uncharacterized protein n=1 Tax=Budvicia aquatica TaxID=82979 RepID=A0A484ZE43_9GAMM|nr:Uncharacterised protein [Budvicia aquatica]